MEQHVKHLRICSDLHSEFWVRNRCLKKTLRILNSTQVLPPLDEDFESVLVIAGDLGSTRNRKNQQRAIFENLLERFPYIIICKGNHEFYDGDFSLDEIRYKDFYEEVGKGRILFSSSFGIKGKEYLTFLVDTLWTDYQNENPLAIEIARKGMNDYSQITINGERFLTPYDVLTEHKVAISNITKRLETLKEEGKKAVIVTHHAPSISSVPPQFKTSKLNPCYYSSLEPLIEKYKDTILYWIHGHTHLAQDYEIAGVRVICNPFGYRLRDRRTGYNPKLTLPI